MTVRELQRELAKYAPETRVVCIEESEAGIRPLFIRGASPASAEWERDESGEIQIRFVQSQASRLLVAIDISPED